MVKKKYCNILDVCTFLAKYRPRYASYGLHTEFVHGAEMKIREVPAIKPKSLFRGQTKAWETLRPKIYRNHPLHSTWQEETIVKIDDDILVMPHPHYCTALERDFYFSCVKAVDIIWEVARKFPDYPEDKVDGHALCQHYGLPTHYLDFTEVVQIAGFFASHDFQNGTFIPCADGIGVMYVLEVDKVPPKTLYEIGFQPLPRPFAQRGWLLQVPPEVDLLAHPAVWKIYFRHSAVASKSIGEYFRQGQDLLPVDEISEYIESRLSEKTVSKEAIEGYLNRVPKNYQPRLRASIKRLFEGSITIL